jgi:2-keto-myo-inositol isomerase
MFPEHTGIVHVSGVVDGALAVSEMADRHRVLVDGRDRLGNVAQLAELGRAGWDGPVSFECFAPEVHALADPRAEIARSMSFIRSELAAKAA